jgi:hypothetical protein
LSGPRPSRLHCGRDTRAPEAAPVIIVHSLAHSVAALSAAVAVEQPVVLASAPVAGVHAGPGWWREMLQAARDAVPAARGTAWLDCGDDAGAAMAAIRAGIEAVIFTGRSDVARRLADIAAPAGTRLLTVRPEPALDLGPLFFADAETLRRRCAEVFRGG